MVLAAVFIGIKITAAPSGGGSQVVEWDRNFQTQWISCYEQQRSTGSATCTVTLIRDITEDIGLTVTYSTENPTGSAVAATAGGSCGGTTDYVSVSGGTIVFGSTDLTKTGTITICNNQPGSAEVHEAFQLDITNSGVATIGDANADGATGMNALVRIVDNYKHGDTGFYTSNETDCDGSDSTVIWCDDFEDGSWGEGNDSGSFGSNMDDGWELTEFAPPTGSAASWPDGTAGSGTEGGWARCGGLGVAGTDCVAYAGDVQCGAPAADTNGIIGTHRFAPNGATSTQTEIWFRWYSRMLPGYTGPRHEKLNIMQSGESSNWQQGEMIWSFSGLKVAYETLNGGSGERSQNQGNDITVTIGDWMFHEMHMELGTGGNADGTLEYWSNNCGSDGLGCTGTPTLRMQFSGNIQMRGGTQKIGEVWFEDFSNTGTQQNPSSCGEQYYDQLKMVNSGGPIGFMVNQ